MRKKILFSASIFHAVNDAATVTIPMLFPLLYSKQIIIHNYSMIGVLSNLGLLMTFVFQMLVGGNSHKFEYRHMVLISILGISFSIFAITFCSSFISLLFLYLIMRISASIYHPLGISMVSRFHPGEYLDTAIGIQGGSGNLGVFLAFLSTGYLAQKFGWKIPLYIWGAVIFLVGSISFFLVRKISSRLDQGITLNFSAWKKSFSYLVPHIPGLIFGGACWATTIYFAPSLFTHRFALDLGTTGLFLAIWIGLGTTMTYIFGWLSRKLGRAKLTMGSYTLSSVFLLLLGVSSSKALALAVFFLYGALLFLIFPAIQSSLGETTPTAFQTLAFSLLANVLMLTGAFFSLLSGILADHFGINTPFLCLAVLGIVISFFSLKHYRNNSLN
ncbi:MAG: MFS transporter [Candidatus Aminicenantes bacterium]|nr:MFS transporter [Candidatus Aminicenantes bacterium]